MRKLQGLKTGELTDLILFIDNGKIDFYCENNPKKYKYCERARKEIIEILLERYSYAIEVKGHVNYYLRRAYDIILKHYLK